MPGVDWWTRCGRWDLRDAVRRRCVERVSVRHHADRVALVHDTERHDTAATLGQTVLRLARQHPVQQPAYVVETLTAWVEAQDARGAA